MRFNLLIRLSKTSSIRPITGNNLIGYSINIGNIISRAYINGALYLNGDLVVRQRNQNYYANAVEFAQYINQI